MWENGGAKSYQVRIRVRKPVTVGVGRLGTFLFPAGEYVYTGSAKKNLGARVARHFAPARRLRWHIDYLLSAPGVQAVGYAVFDEAECDVNRKSPGTVIVPRFGATDCRSGCGSHLKFLGAGETPGTTRWRKPR